MDIDRLIADRSRKVDASGIRRVFDLGAKLKDPINLSIGQPDFPVPASIKRAGIDAIEKDRNGYTVTQGIPELRERIVRHLMEDVGWDADPKPPNGPPHRPGLLVSPGTSASLVLAFMALIGPGDEAIIPDPYFVLYPHLATIVGGKAVRCDTYPDFQMTAERVERLITPRTKLVLLNSPGNPSGVVATQKQCADLLDLCRRKNVLLISDEIYDEFTYAETRTEKAHKGGRAVGPSPARVPGSFEDMLIVRGLGKTYGVTGWRLGYAAGPARLLAEMTKLQQYTYVCAPAPLQWGGLAAFDVDMSPHVAAYQKRRDMVVERLRRVTDVAMPGGAFYAFTKVPERLGLTATQFVDRAIERSLLVIPGSVFSDRDTHFRLSYATSEATLARGLDVLADLMK
jgi:aspartate/methionine/tyrosine aminotransferase